MMKQVVGACSVFLVLTAAASAQVPAGGEFRVNTYTTSNQFIPHPAMGPDGDFVVVWSSDYQDGGNRGVFGQRFAASGAPRGSEFQINTYTTQSQSSPAVAVGSGGDFVVVWTSYGQDGPASIQGQRYDTAGNPIGGEFEVSPPTTCCQTQPHVGRAADGRFVVLWTSGTTSGPPPPVEGAAAPLDGAGYGIAARRFDASGNPIGSEFVVNTFTFGDQFAGDIAVAANGDFVAVWVDFERAHGIFGQRYDASGNRLGSEFQVNSFTPGAADASVSVSPMGGFVVTWSSYGDGSGASVYARLFDASGNAVGDEFLVNTYTPDYQQYGHVAHDARGNFVITWTSRGQDGSGTGIFAQRFSASGARRGLEFRVNTYITGYQFSSTVASDATGNFLIAWQSGGGQDGDGYGVFAQRFFGLLAPAALTVDGFGNQVLEPGETVDVRPSWRNISGAPQTFGGTLTNITGPPGATYTIIDSAGDYGTVADGATAPCADCYAVTVSNPNSRPAVHWDASAVESIVPDTPAQQQWLLHVGVSFTDVATASPFYRFIETLLHVGVTAGCSTTAYCPAASTTREQMAVFVLVAKEGTGYVPPACTTPVFNDVPSSHPFCRWIEELARRGVVSGCDDGNYCPTDDVTREQMAVFVLRTLEPWLVPPACTTPMYNDVPADSGFCAWIEELTRRGVVSGCGGGNYCPTDAVTREQMGVFISATFGLTLYGP